MDIKKRADFSIEVFKNILKDKKSLADRVIVEEDSEIEGKFYLNRDGVKVVIELPHYLLDRHNKISKKQLFIVLAFEMYKLYYMDIYLDEFTFNLEHALKALFKEDYEKFVLFYSIYSEIGILSDEY